MGRRFLRLFFEAYHSDVSTFPFDKTKQTIIIVRSRAKK